MLPPTTLTLVATGFIAIFALVGVYVQAVEESAPVPQQKNITVARTASGFEPERVLIHKGTTVTFINNTDAQFWPASDSHPSHGMYPAFDPKHPLAPNESWSFTFDTPGVWTFHDHLDSRITGKVLVLGDTDESIDECLTVLSGTTQARCWEAEITNTLEKEGFDAAFDTFKSFYDEYAVFQNKCHDITHVIGEASYYAFVKNGITVERPETALCGYGFYHGFIETMFAKNGSLDLEEGHRYCNVIRFSDAFTSPELAIKASHACYHGLGHALFDSINGIYWGNAEHMVKIGIQGCENMFAVEEKQVQCASGVFNSLANAYSARDYQLSYDDLTDPFALCKKQESQYLTACYKEMTTGYIGEKRMNLQESIAFVENISDPVLREEGMFSLIDNIYREQRFPMSIEDYASLCEEQEKSLRDDCIRGVIIGISQSTLTGDELGHIISFCALFPENSELRHTCLQHNMKIVWYDDTELAQACNKSFVAQSDREACLK